MKDKYRKAAIVAATILGLAALFLFGWTDWTIAHKLFHLDGQRRAWRTEHNASCEL